MIIPSLTIRARGLKNPPIRAIRRSMQEKISDQSHENSPAGEHQVTAMATNEKETTMEHREHHDDMTLNNIVYDEDELEPQLHWRSWVVVVAMCLLQFVQLTALVSITTFVR